MASTGTPASHPACSQAAVAVSPKVACPYHDLACALQPGYLQGAVVIGNQVCGPTSTRRIMRAQGWGSRSVSVSRSA